MTTVTIPAKGKTYTLTDDQGTVVLIDPAGKSFGPWDNVIDMPDARMSGGERYHFQMTARAIASYARDDHRDNPEVIALVRAFEAVPNPQLRPK